MSAALISPFLASKGSETALASFQKCHANSMPFLGMHRPVRVHKSTVNAFSSRKATHFTAERPEIHSFASKQFDAPRRRKLIFPINALPDPLPDGAGTAKENTSPNNNSSSSDNSDSKTTEVKIDLQLPRRSRLIAFNCNICGGRTERLVNPVAWERGMVIVQCKHCESWHKVADAANLVEEIRYKDLENLGNSDDE